jgi:uroporphyrinogen III methyltransferase/synthase
VFTSGNGVRLFFQALARQEVDLRRLHACRFAVIGAATGAALKEHGIHPDLCPAVYTGEALAQALRHAVPPEEPILLLRSARGAARLCRSLAGTHTVRDIPLYALRADPETASAARPRLAEADYLAFSSASGVELFFETHGAIPDRAVCVCIGDVTAKALAARYEKPFLTAPEISAEGILRAILDHRTAAKQ